MQLFDVEREKVARPDKNCDNATMEIDGVDLER